MIYFIKNLVNPRSFFPVISKQPPAKNLQIQSPLIAPLSLPRRSRFRLTSRLSRRESSLINHPRSPCRPLYPSQDEVVPLFLAAYALDIPFTFCAGLPLVASGQFEHFSRVIYYQARIRSLLLVVVVVVPYPSFTRVYQLLVHYFTADSGDLVSTHCLSRVQTHRR